MKILHVIPSLSGRDGGPSQAMVDIEAALAQAGVQVTTATTRSHSDDDRLPARDERVVRIVFDRWTRAYKIAPGLAFWLWRNVKTFDIVHIHALFSFSSAAAAIVCRLRSAPYVVRPLGTLTRYGLTRRPRLKRLALALVDGPAARGAAFVHFTSRAECDEAQALNLALRAAIIPLGVRAPDIAPLEEGVGLGEDFTILFLSRLDPKKNVEALIDALARLRAHGPPFVALVAGAGAMTYVDALKARAAACGVGERIVWLGHVEGARKAAALAAADVFVLPSFSENFGIAAAEALSAGLPCVLGQGVAIADEIVAAGCGIAIAPEAGALAAALLRLATDAPAREAMSARARVFAQEQYGLATMARRLVELYRTIIAESRRP